jgi:mono/diheme cytochrome c family protein
MNRRLARVFQSSWQRNSVLVFLLLISIAPFFQNCSPNFAVNSDLSQASVFSDPLAPGVSLTAGSRSVVLSPADSIVAGLSYTLANKTSATLSLTSIPLGNCLRTTAIGFSCAQAGTISIKTDPTTTDKVGHETALGVVTESDLSARGASIYEARCASCHSSLAASTKRSRTLAQISDSMVNEPQMASLRGLSATDLVALKVVLSGAATPTPTPLPTPPPTPSEVLYINNCASCHGDVANSSKRGKSAGVITAAISNVSSMRTPALLRLTSTEIQMIADAIK